MNKHVDLERKVRNAIWFARFATFIFGFGLLIWGLAPVIMRILSSGELPSQTALTTGGVTLIVGAGFLVLAMLIGRAAWALWLTFTLSLVLLIACLALNLGLIDQSTPSLFPLLLALGTASTCWLALEARRQVVRSMTARWVPQTQV